MGPPPQLPSIPCYECFGTFARAGVWGKVGLGNTERNRMATVATANLVGITGIARRLVMDGALDETVARDAMAAATKERRPLAGYLLEKRLIAPADLAAANSIEFGMPLFDVTSLDPAQSAIKLVSEVLVRKHSALPLFRRGNKLFVGLSDPT